MPFRMQATVNSIGEFTPYFIFDPTKDDIIGRYYYTVTYKYAADAPAFIKGDLEIIVNDASSSDTVAEEDEDEADSDSELELSVGANSSTASEASVFTNVETKLEDELPLIFSLGQDFPEIEVSLGGTIQMIDDNATINPDLEMIVDVDDLKFINFLRSKEVISIEPEIAEIGEYEFSVFLRDSNQESEFIVTVRIKEGKQHLNDDKEEIENEETENDTDNEEDDENI